MNDAFFDEWVKWPDASEWNVVGTRGFEPLTSTASR